MVGVFGYAYSRPIGQRRWWVAWLPIQVSWDAFVTFVLGPQGLAYAMPDAEPLTAAENLGAVLILVPLYSALYLYAFRSPQLWTGESEVQR